MQQTLKTNCGDMVISKNIKISPKLIPPSRPSNKKWAWRMPIPWQYCQTGCRPGHRWWCSAHHSRCPPAPSGSVADLPALSRTWDSMPVGCRKPICEMVTIILMWKYPESAERGKRSKASDRGPSRQELSCQASLQDNLPSKTLSQPPRIEPFPRPVTPDGDR